MRYLSEEQLYFLLDLLEEKAGETEDEETLNLIQSLFEIFDGETSPNFKPFPEV